MNKPKCKCGKPCELYGGIGSYSVRCVDCNLHGAKLARESRARLNRRSRRT